MNRPTIRSTPGRAAGPARHGGAEHHVVSAAVAARAGWPRHPGAACSGSAGAAARTPAGARLSSAGSVSACSPMPAGARARRCRGPAPPGGRGRRGRPGGCARRPRRCAAVLLGQPCGVGRGRRHRRQLGCPALPQDGVGLQQLADHPALRPTVQDQVVVARHQRPAPVRTGAGAPPAAAGRRRSRSPGRGRRRGGSRA